MNIIVCIKQVPSTADVKTDPKTGTIIRIGVPSMINPEDKNALEMAIELKEKYGFSVTVLTMGPKQAKYALREALSMGADEAVLISDKYFAGADTWATAVTLGESIKLLAPYKIIICGREASDGNTAQIGPQLAEYLDIPQITYTCQYEWEYPIIRVRKEVNYGYEFVETELPVLLTVMKELNKTRYLRLLDIKRAFQMEIKEIKLQDLPLKAEEVGLKGSPTRVKKIYSPKAKGEVEFFYGSITEKTKALIDILTGRNIV